MTYLTYRGYQWDDMSEFVVHFTKDTEGATASENLWSILREGQVTAQSPMGFARRDTTPKSQNAASFSEVPLHLVHRLANRRSRYGVGFHHSVLQLRGGSRVWYVEKDTLPAMHLEQLKHRHLHIGEDGSPDRRDPFWEIAPFIDFPGDYSGIPYRFEWEREWRITEYLLFNAEEVAFVFLPEDQHESFRTWTESRGLAADNRTIVAPAIDPYWPRDQIVDALNVGQ